MRLRPVLAAVLTGAALAARVAGAGGLPAFEELRASQAPSDSVLLDRNGATLSEVELDPRGRRLGWVPLAELSPAVPAALLAAEDRRFLEHAGVDWQALAGAMWDNLRRAAEGRRLRGASTLSMQVAALLDPALRLRAGSRTLAQKWDQARAAQELERTWTKSQILEAYVNLATFRGGLRGVHEAAQGLFGRHPAELGAAESLVLGALLRGPDAAPEVVVRRACAVAASVAAAPRCAAIRDIAMPALSRPARLPPRRNDAPHLARLLLHGPGEQLTVTVDAATQRQLRDLVTAATDSAGAGALAAVLLDNASGDVLGWVGAADPDAADGVLRPRVVDGALDPLLAAVALELRLLTAASPLDLARVGGEETGAAGAPPAMRTASLRQALVEEAPELSGILGRVNGAAISAERLRLFGFDVAPPTQASPGPAFEPPAVTLVELANAYRALGGGGEWRALGLLRGTAATERRRALHAEAAFVAADMLVARMAGNDRPALHCGVERGGTDAVCAAFNERYTVAVAAGAGASGRASAEALARRVLHPMPELPPAMPARAPAGVTARMVGYDPPVEGTRREWFLAGTETLQAGLSETTRAVVVSPRIQYPADGEVLALPSIGGREAGRVVPRAGPEAGGTQWRLDGAVVSSAQRRGFAATPGRHRLELLGSSGEVLDAVRFEVVLP
ncbi:MAG: transglycosylase domain-containing protein [Betaproteobacteria bacterium]|nr:transglycosylase domain-containing protein [Betaproteobacteria bacterium]